MEAGQKPGGAVVFFHALCAPLNKLSLGLPKGDFFPRSDIRPHFFLVSRRGFDGLSISISSHTPHPVPALFAVPVPLPVTFLQPTRNTPPHWGEGFSPGAGSYPSLNFIPSTFDRHSLNVPLAQQAEHSGEEGLFPRSRYERPCTRARHALARKGLAQWPVQDAAAPPHRGRRLQLGRRSATEGNDVFLSLRPRIPSSVPVQPPLVVSCV